MEIDICHWCEQDIGRADSSRAWVERGGGTNCEFHPAAYDARKIKRLNEDGVHQNLYEVHDIVANHYWATKLKPTREVTANIVITSTRSQTTSRQAAEKFLPRSGTVRKQVYDIIKRAGYRGMTDYELEGILKISHQTVSASRRSLVINGWLVDSGNKRTNAQDNDCIVWIEKSAAFVETLFA
jgi:hypothetical protein